MNLIVFLLLEDRNLSLKVIEEFRGTAVLNTCMGMGESDIEIFSVKIILMEV